MIQWLTPQKGVKVERLLNRGQDSGDMVWMEDVDGEAVVEGAVEWPGLGMGRL